MVCKQFLGSLIVLLGSAALACGQTGLGAPATTDGATETLNERGPRIRRPLFGPFVRTMFAPFRYALMAPQPIVEASPTKADVARMVADGGYSPAEITAAKIKIDETQAKQRQAAVRYLASVDCHYYPEAEAGLIAALRADRSESVRYEAAVALGSCKGTTRKILEALNLTALGQETDGNPSESSERVRQAARQSLNRALTNGMAMIPMEMPQMMPTMPMMEWFDPYQIQPTNYYLPLQFPASVPPPIASPQERERAATVSVPAKSTPAPSNPRSLVEWIQNYTSPRDQDAARKNAERHMRGLAPLGSQIDLAIPAAPAYPMPYNQE